MAKNFNCPACGKLMEYDGSTTLFQTCGSCYAPIVVPSEVIERNRDSATESIVNMPDSQANYAAEFKKDVDSQTPIENWKATSDALIFEEIKAGNKIKAIKLHRETFGTDLLTAKNAIETIEREIENSSNFQTQVEKTEFINLDKNQIFEKIHSELRAGRKINAIKIYREITGCGLAEAKDAVDEIESQNRYIIKDFPQNFEARNLTASIGSNSQLGLIKNELRKGNKINAIKLFRETYNTGLKEAKDAVEAMERGEEINISDYQ